MQLPFASVIIATIAQAAQTTAPAAPVPPPQVVVTPPPPAPPVRVLRSRAETASRLETFRVEILADRELLWAGAMNVADQAQGSFNQTFRNPALRCLEDGQWRDSVYVQSSQLRFTIEIPRAIRNEEENLNRFTVDAHWERALPDCFGGGQATVGLRRTVLVAEGATEDVAGDAGLVVRLTRLKPAK